MTARFRPTRRAALVGASALALTAGRAAAQAPATPKKGGTLNFMQNSEPQTLVALTTVATPALTVSAKVTEGLLEYDYDIEPRPQLATEWTISPDGKTYTFKLRPNVKFHDGKPFTSADVAYSIQLLKTVHPRGRNTFANVVEVKTPDPLTAILELSKPAPYLIKALTAAEAPMMPRHIYEGTDPLANPNGNAPIGTGPFKFKEWVRGSHIIYERNPDYWDAPKPYVDRIVCKFLPDPGARSIAFENGSADIGYRTPVALSDLERLKKVPSLRFETKGTSYSYNVSTLQFNLDSQYFKNLKVRQAVAHAIDRETLIKTVAFGYGTVCYSPIAPGLKAFHDPTPSPYKLDLKKAEALLDEAGFPRGANKTRFKVPLDYNPIGGAPRSAASASRSTSAPPTPRPSLSGSIPTASSISLSTDIPTCSTRRSACSASTGRRTSRRACRSPTARTTTTPRSTPCSRRRRSRTTRSSASRCSSTSSASSPRKCRTSRSTRRST